MKIESFKKEILSIIGEVFELEEADISYIDFIKEANYPALKIVVSFKLSNKKYGISYMIFLEEMEYGLKEFEYRIKEEFKKLKNKEIE